MSEVSSVGSGGGSKPDATSQALRGVDMDEFLQLLITELQNQDPLDPLDNSQLLSQISQIREISSTDQLSDTLDAVTTGQQLTTASGMIGKEIRALSDDGKEVQGVVARVSISPSDDDGSRQLKLHVGDQTVSVNNIQEILPPGRES